MNKSLRAAARSFAPYQWWRCWYDGAGAHESPEGVLMWVYREEGCSGFTRWVVGFFDPAGEWHPDGSYDDRAKAAARCRWLNGG